MRAALLALSLLAGSCFYPGTASVPATPEQDLWERCSGILRATRCSNTMFARPNAFYVMLCMHRLRDGYRNDPDPKRWMLRNGCPAAMVEN